MQYSSSSDSDSDSSAEEIDYEKYRRTLDTLNHKRSLRTFGSITNQYKKVHPEVTQQQILQKQALLQNDKVTLDNIDLIELETARIVES